MSVIKMIRDLLAQSNAKSQKQARRASPKSSRAFQTLEDRSLMNADLIGVVRDDLWLLNYDGDTTHEIDFQYGLTGDKAIVGDWLGRGHDDVGVVRSGSGDGLLHWYLDTDNNRTHNIDIAYGLPGDIPVVGDWDRDGTDNVGVVRYNAGDRLLHWYLDTDRDPTHEIDVAFGLLGDTPVVGDWNGDGRDDVGVVRGGYSDGLARWFLDLDGDPDHELEYVYGFATDKPVVGDWDRTGTDNIGVVRGGYADGLTRWLLDTDGDPTHEIEDVYGFGGDTPVVGQWFASEITVPGYTSNQSQSVDFGAVLEGTAGPTRTFRIQNDGTIWMAVPQIVVPNGFSVLRQPANALPPGAFDDLVVGLNTTQPGQFSGSVSIFTSDSNENPFVIPISGRVIARVPEIAIDGITDGQSTPVDLGTALFGSAPIDRTFTVRNVGTMDLQIGAISTTLGTVVKGLPTVLAPNQADSFTIRVGTASVGRFNGTVSIANSDADENPFNFTVVANVTDPEIAVYEVSADLLTWTPIADGQTRVIDFGSVPRGSTAERVFAVRNTGTATLTIGYLTVPVGFTRVEGLAYSIAPEGYDLFTIGLPTSSVGTLQGQVVISNNDRDENPFNFGIRGTVTPAAPEIVVDGIIDGQSTVIDFGTVAVGANVTRTFTVRNTGTAPLTLGTINLPTGFTIAKALASTLAPNAADTFTVRLNTSSVRTASGTLSFTNNDSDESPFNFQVRGVVVGAPEIQVRVNGTLVNGTTANGNLGYSYPSLVAPSVSVQVTNAGTANLILSNLSLGAGFSATLPASVTLAPGASQSFTVRLNQSTLGLKQGAFSFMTNDADESAIRVNLLGEVFENVRTVGGNPAPTNNGDYVITAHPGSTLKLSPAHGAMPFGGRYVLEYSYSGGSLRIAIDSTLRRLVIRGSRSVSVSNLWTGIPVVFQ